MNKRCINPNSIQVKELSDELGLKPIIVAAKIAVWQDKNNTYDFPSANDLVEGINYSIKAIDILLSDKAKQIFSKGEKANWNIDKILQELQIPKEQKQLVIDSYNEGNKTPEQLAIDIASKYSYNVEVKTAVSKNALSASKEDFLVFEQNGKYYTDSPDTGKVEITKEQYERLAYGTTQHYSNLTVPGGTNYTENEIATPAITPSIKGHAQFATEQGIGWFRSDDKHSFTGFLEDLIASGTIKKVPCG